MSLYFGGPNRYLCDVLNEMRDCLKTYNFSYLLSLIEEAQSMGNRMEAALADQKDMKDWKKQKHKLKQELKDLSEETEKLEKQRDKLKKQIGFDK